MGKALLLALIFPRRSLTALAQFSVPKRGRKWVLIFDSLSNASYSDLISRADTQISRRDPQWKKHLVLLDSRNNAHEVSSFIKQYGPNTKQIVYPVLVRVPDGVPGMVEVEIWSPAWLNASYRNFEDACYPISSGWWSVDGDWNPSIKKVRDHLYRSPNHTGGKFQSEWLELLKFEELQSLHSDHHREMTHDGTVLWKSVNAECPSTCNPKPIPYTGTSTTIRRGESVTLGGMPIYGQTYQWTPTATLDSPTASSPVATPINTTEYTLTVSNACGTATSKVTITVVS